MTIGSKIAEYRKARGMTQDALAQLLGVTNQAVSKWESDQSCPDVMLLPQIADIFETTLDDLFGRKGKSEPIVQALPWPDDNILRAVVYVGHRLKGSAVNKRGFVISCMGDVDGIESQVCVQCGDVHGDVRADANVTCGNVTGDVDAGTRVRCEEVKGSVDAGTDVTCGNVGGDVDAGCNVTCGNVAGDVDAGCNVTCGDVDGDVDAGCGVTIRK